MRERICPDITNASRGKKKKKKEAAECYALSYASAVFRRALLLSG